MLARYLRQPLPRHPYSQEVASIRYDAVNAFRGRRRNNPDSHIQFCSWLQKLMSNFAALKTPSVVIDAPYEINSILPGEKETSVEHTPELFENFTQALRKRLWRSVSFPDDLPFEWMAKLNFRDLKKKPVWAWRHAKYPDYV